MVNIATRPAVRWWREYRGSLLFLFLMLVFRSAWADWVSVPTGSMNPTILEGDRVLVDKHVYGLRVPWTLMRLTDGRDPARGEIVVFDSPLDGTSLVKRVIGLPGDVIALDDLGLSINGVYADYVAGRSAAPVHFAGRHAATTAGCLARIRRASGARHVAHARRRAWTTRIFSAGTGAAGQLPHAG